MNDRWCFLSQLGECALFSGLPESILVAVLWNASVVRFAPGEAVVQRGEPSDALVVMVEGLAAVTSVAKWAPGSDAIGWIKPGESIGEIGILTAGPRTATVTAITATTALRIPAARFSELMGLHPQLSVRVSTLLARRLASTLSRQRTVEQRGKVVTIVSANPLAPAPLIDAITANAEGSVHTIAATCEQQHTDAHSTTEAVERMIATGQQLDTLAAEMGFVVVTLPPDIDPAYARPVLERSDLVLVSSQEDSHTLRHRLRELAGEQNPGIVQVDFVADSAQVVFDRLGRPHEVAIFIPTTVDVDQEIDPAPYVNAATSLFGDCFGGATVREAKGVWKSEDLGLVGERILMVIAACGREQLNRSLNKITSHMLALKGRLRQEAMAMSVDGRLILL